MNLPEDPGFHFAFRLRERPYAAEQNGKSFRVFRRFPTEEKNPADPQLIPDVYVENFLPLNFFELPRLRWFDCTVPVLLQNGSLADTKDTTLRSFIEAENPVTKTDPRVRARDQAWSQLQSPAPSAAKGKGSPRLPDDRSLWLRILQNDLPYDAFLLSHPYERDLAWVQGQTARYILRIQGRMTFKKKEMKIRSVRSEADIPRIAKIVRGGEPELFGHHSCRALIGAPPMASFVALYQNDNAAEKKARRKRENPNCEAHKWKVAGVIIASVRNPPRRREPEPPTLDPIRVRNPVTGNPISAGYIALVNVKPKFAGLRIGRALVDLFLGFAMNVYGVTIFNAELPDNEDQVIEFFESRGFRKFKHVPRYYADGRGSFWMEKNRLQETSRTGWDEPDLGTE
jgi:ribosomal protein S18 acetylase RimI-like enzyme